METEPASMNLHLELIRASLTRLYHTNPNRHRSRGRMHARDDDDGL